MAQLLDGALANMCQKYCVFTAHTIFSGAKHGLFRVPQPTCTLGQTISKDDLVSESFIPILEEGI